MAHSLRIQTDTQMFNPTFFTSEKPMLSKAMLAAIFALAVSTAAFAQQRTPVLSGDPPPLPGATLAPGDQRPTLQGNPPQLPLGSRQQLPSTPPQLPSTPPQPFSSPSQHNHDHSHGDGHDHSHGAHDHSHGAHDHSHGAHDHSHGAHDHGNGAGHVQGPRGLGAPGFQGTPLIPDSGFRGGPVQIEPYYGHGHSNPQDSYSGQHGYGARICPLENGHYCPYEQERTTLNRNHNYSVNPYQPRSAPRTPQTLRPAPQAVPQYRNFHYDSGEFRHYDW